MLMRTNDPEKTLALFSSLGSIFEGSSFDQAYKKAFIEEFKKANEEGKEPADAFRLASKKAAEESLKAMPLLFRLNFYCNIWKKDQDELIDWDHINKVLNENLHEFDFDAGRREVHSYKELTDYRVDVELATSDINPWIKRKCKECGRDFIMLFSEAVYFEEKGLKLPRRCYECRKGIKSTESKDGTKVDELIKEREEFKTSAFKSALTKANLI